MIIDYCREDNIENIIEAVESNLACYITSINYSLLGNNDFYKTHKIKRYYNFKAIRIKSDNSKEKLTIRIGVY